MWSDLLLLLTRHRLSYTWATRGGEGFPEGISKAFSRSTGTGGRILNIIVTQHEIFSLFVLTSISSLVPWFIVRFKPCKHCCWTRLLALFQTNHTRLLFSRVVTDACDIVVVVSTSSASFPHDFFGGLRSTYSPVSTLSLLLQLFLRFPLPSSLLRPFPPPQ